MERLPQNKTLGQSDEEKITKESLFYLTASNGFVSLYNNKTGKLIKEYENIHSTLTMKGIPNTVEHKSSEWVTTTKNGTHLFTHGYNGNSYEICQWSIIILPELSNASFDPVLKLFNTYKIPGQVYTMRISLDDKYLLVGDIEGNFTRLDIADKFKNSEPFSIAVYGQAFNILQKNTNEIIIIGAGDKSYGLLKCIDIFTGSCIEVCDNFPNTGVNFMEMLPDNNTFIYDTKFGEIHIWNLKEKCIERNFGIVFERRSPYKCWSLSGDQKTVFTGDKTGKLLQWDISKGKLWKDYGQVFNQGISCLQKSTNNMMIYIGSNDGHLKAIGSKKGNTVKDYINIAVGAIESICAFEYNSVNMCKSELQKIYEDLQAEMKSSLTGLVIDVNGNACFLNMRSGSEKTPYEKLHYSLEAEKDTLELNQPDLFGQEPREAACMTSNGRY